MAGRIRDEDIALVREKSAIDEVVGEYLQLRNAGGGSLKGLCPFHDEKTPSFNVTPARGLWYCFSCANGGDVIKFVQKIDSLSFVESVERLAARAGIDLRYEQGGQVPGREHSQRRRLLEAHQAAAEYYAERLHSPDAVPGREFLTGRGFTLADAEHFGVGYAPAEWEALTRHLRGRGFTEQELLAGGLASQGRRGAMDRFRGRLMWPIRDLTGDVIAFGARKLNPDEDGPKYLNTPETPLFRKSTVLYGADLAKREIAARRQAVIVEGYTDVMACHLAGVGTAVATSGTSFGDGHIKILRRLLMDADQFRGEVIFTFDGDAAGQRAVLRAFDLEEHFVTQTFVAVQRDGLDPCDLRLKQGEQAVRDLIAQRLPVFEFAIRSELAKHNLDTNEGRLAALDAAARIIARIKDRGLRDRYAVSLDRWLGMLNEDFVLARVREHETSQDTRRGGWPRPGPRRRVQAGALARPGAAWWRASTDRTRPGRPGWEPVRLERSRGQPGTPGAQAGHPAPGPVRPGLRHAAEGRFQRAGARLGPRADRGLRGSGGRRNRPGMGRPPDRRGPERPGPGVRHPARRGAGGDAAGGRRGGRAVRRGSAGPGSGTGGEPADLHAEIASAASEPDRQPERLQPDVRRSGGAGAAPEGPPGAGFRCALRPVPKRAF